LLDASGSVAIDPEDLPDGGLVAFEWLLDPGTPGERPLGTAKVQEATIPLGTHDVRLRVTDWIGGSATTVLRTRIVDTRPPMLGVSVRPAILFPPTGKMVPVHLTLAASDACDPDPRIALIDITSTDGPGVVGRDVQGADFGTPDTEMSLRAAL